MRVRLRDNLNKDGGALVKDTEAVMVDIDVHPLDRDMVNAALAEGGSTIYCRHLPLGIWLSVVGYTKAPVTRGIRHAVGAEHARSLVYLEPRTQKFTWRGYVVTRTGFALSHARVVTSTACRGRTMRQGVVIDGGLNPDVPRYSSAQHWLHMYVMMSRATRLQDILLLRAPDVEFWLESRREGDGRQGPPKDLRRALDTFARKASDTRRAAEELVTALNFREFLHE